MFRFIRNLITNLFRSVLSCLALTICLVVTAIAILLLLPSDCEAATVSTESKLSAMTLSFDGDISMYYYFETDTAFEKDTDNYVKVVVGSGANEIVRTADVTDMYKVKDDDDHIGLKVSIPAKMMGANVFIGLYNSDDTLLVSYGLQGGATSSAKSSAQNYNASYYAKTVIEDADNVYSEELEDMVRAMLNYGAKSQVLFNYDTENLVNEGYEMTDTDTDPASITNAVYEETEDKTDIIWQKAALYANSLTTMRIYFIVNGSFSGATINGSSASAFASGYEGEYYVDIPISAQNLKTSYTIAATSASSSSELKINGYYVLKQLLAIGANANVTATADALYKFGRYADVYFSKTGTKATIADLAIKTGCAYYEKCKNIQYDMKGAYYKSSTNQSRRQMYTSPEDISEYKNYYMDCSSYCFNVYREVIGEENTINLLASSVAKRDNFRTQYLTSYPNSKAVVKTYTDLASEKWYSDGTKSTAITNWTNTINDAKKVMKAGDLFVFYGVNSSGNTGGHIMLWTGSGFLHCTGGSFDVSSGTDTIEPNGAIYYMSSSEFTYKTTLQRHGASIVVILRPSLIYDENDLTDYAYARAELGSISLDITATNETTGVNLYAGQSVASGDEISYSISLKNKNYVGNISSDRRVRVTATLPSGIEVLETSTGAYIDGNTIIWDDVSLAKDGALTFAINGSVKDDTYSLGEYIGTAKVSVTSLTAGKSASAITAYSSDVTCEEAVSSDVTSKISALSTSYSSYSKNSGTSGISIVNKVFSDVSGKSVSLASSDSDLLYNIFKDGSNNNFIVKYSKKSSFKNLVSNFAAGLYVYNSSATSGDFSYKNAVRYISEDNLKLGDVIQAYDGSEYIYYIYIGSNKLMKIEDGETAIVSFSYIVSDTEKGVAASLFAKKAFAVFRLLGR